MLKIIQTLYDIKNILYIIMQSLYVCVHIRILYGMTKFVGLTDRLTTCQFLCLTAAF